MKKIVKWILIAAVFFGFGIYGQYLQRQEDLIAQQQGWPSAEIRDDAFEAGYAEPDAWLALKREEYAKQSAIEQAAPERAVLEVAKNRASVEISQPGVAEPAEVVKVGQEVSESSSAPSWLTLVLIFVALGVLYLLTIAREKWELKNHDALAERDKRLHEKEVLDAEVEQVKKLNELEIHSLAGNIDRTKDADRQRPSRPTGDGTDEIAPATRALLFEILRDATAGFRIYQWYRVNLEAHFPELIGYLGPIALMRFEDKFSKIIFDGAPTEDLLKFLHEILIFNECLSCIKSVGSAMVHGDDSDYPFDERLASINSFIKGLSSGSYSSQGALQVFSEAYSSPTESSVSAHSAVSDYCSEMNIMDHKHATDDAKDTYADAIRNMFTNTEEDERLSAVRQLIAKRQLVEAVIGHFNNVDILERCVAIEIHVNGDLDSIARQNNGSPLPGHKATRRLYLTMDGKASRQVAQLHSCHEAWTRGLKNGLSAPSLTLVGRRIKALLAESDKLIGGVAAMASASELAEQGDYVVALWLKDVSPYLESNFFEKRIEFYKNEIYDIKEGDFVSSYWLDRNDCPDYDFRYVWGFFSCGDGSTLNGKVQYSELVEMFNASAGREDWLACSFAYIYMLRLIDYLNKYINRERVAEAFEASESERIADLRRQAIEAHLEQRRQEEIRQYQREVREAEYQAEMLASSWAMVSEMENLASNQEMLRNSMISELENLSSQQEAIRDSQNLTNTLTGLSVAINGMNYLETCKIREALT